jgi:hypothetical protein
MLQNPELLQMFINSNPQLSQLAENNSEVKELLTNPQFLQNVMNLQGSMNQGGNNNNNNYRPQRLTLEQFKQKFSNELNYLFEMGFDNENHNIQALAQTGGNVEMAIEIILNLQSQKKE